MATPRDVDLKASTSTALTTTAKPPARSLNRQTVLEEDEYTAALSTIIARDFFPSLAHIDATNSYLSALESEDPHLINSSASRLANLAPTPGRTPWSNQTPFGGPPVDTPLRTPLPSKKPKYDTSLSLDAFQAKYTSEDNASFTEILDDENKKRKERWGWAWEAEKRAMEKKGKEIEGRQKLLIEAGGYPSTSTMQIEAPKEVKAITNGKKRKNEGADEDDPDSETEVEDAMVLMEDPPKDPNELVLDVMAPKKDTRSATVPGWSFKARNSLMFAPDADESPYHPSHLTSDSSSGGDPKVILHSNTRLPSEFEDALALTSPSSSIPPSPARSRVAAAIAGTPYHPRVETPRVRGFGFVSPLPSPTPEQLGPDRVKELMTWGTVQGTPRIVGGDDSMKDMPPPDTPFRIAPPTPRDALARKLGTAASKSLRAKASLLTPRDSSSSGSRRTDMPPPSSTPRRASGLELLSPAGRNLLDRTRGGGLLSRGGIASANSKKRGLDLAKVGWSPRDSPVPKRTRTSRHP